MKPLRWQDSGVFDFGERTKPRLVEPEAIVVGIAWALAVAQVVIGLVRRQPFGADRAVAIAFALGCPFLLRGRLLQLASQVLNWVRVPGKPAKS